MAWEWSCQLPTMVLVLNMPHDIPEHVDRLEAPAGGWMLDVENNKWIGTDGRIKRRADDDVDAKLYAYSGTKIRWIKPWDDDRLGTCALCTVKVADVNVSN
jgi:hypothetical protein